MYKKELIPPTPHHQQTKKKKKTSAQTRHTYPAIGAGNHRVSHPGAKAGPGGSHSDGVAHCCQATTAYEQIPRNWS